MSASPGNTSANVSWSAPFDGGSPVTSYTVTPYAAGVAGTPVVFSSPATTESDERAHERDELHLHGQGDEPHRHGSLLGPVGRRHATGCTGRPDGVSASPGNTSAQVTWSAPFDGGSPVTSYTVTPYAAGVAGTPVLFSSPATTESMAGLTNGTSYTFTVKATNLIGTGPSSAQSSAVMPTGSQGTLVLENGNGTPAGRADQGDSIIITFTTPPSPRAFCSTWFGGSVDAVFGQTSS